VKLTNNRYYFDFNATSPLVPSVTEWLAKGDFLYGNPSSVHDSGKRSRRRLDEVSEYLYSLFQLPTDQFHLVYHSGASEGINMLFKGHALDLLKRKKEGRFAFFSSDHSCLINLRSSLELFGHEVLELPINRDGDCDLSSSLLNKEADLINGTWVNNETGVVTSLEVLEQIKNSTQARIHVDAVQAIGKIKNWNRLNPNLDAYTFSGHKFGAMKGVGFSFIKKDLSFQPLISGGGQQANLRSGTHNTDGIYTLKLALEHLVKHQDQFELAQAKQIIEDEIQKEFSSHIEIAGLKAQSRSSNTICLILPKQQATTIITAFDLAGMDISTGSACSSGALLPSRVLLAMGRSEVEAKSSLRLSFSSYMSRNEAYEYAQKIIMILKRYL
jgi:cysteine desulfurase